MYTEELHSSVKSGQISVTESSLQEMKEETSLQTDDEDEEEMEDLDALAKGMDQARTLLSSRPASAAKAAASAAGGLAFLLLQWTNLLSATALTDWLSDVLSAVLQSIARCCRME